MAFEAQQKVNQSVMQESKGHLGLYLLDQQFISLKPFARVQD